MLPYCRENEKKSTLKIVYIFRMADTPYPPRLNVLKNATRKGLVIPFHHVTLTQLRNDIKQALKMPKVEYLFNPQGCEITDITLVRFVNENIHFSILFIFRKRRQRFVFYFENIISLLHPFQNVLYEQK
jgi:hypothetical protein